MPTVPQYTTPTNRSENKIKVTKLFGGGGTLGYMDAAVNMRVKFGQELYWITGSGRDALSYPLASGNAALIPLALTSGGPQVLKGYAMELQLDVTRASGFGWPTGGGSITLSRSGVFPTGVPNVTPSGVWATTKNAQAGDADGVDNFAR